jgi:perosamine synthetase
VDDGGDEGREGLAASHTVIPLGKPDLGGNEKRYLIECIESGYITHVGRFEKDFEEAFSKRFGVPAIATSSGTGALHLALLSLGVGAGDEVICPDLTFGATASVVLAVGARPVLVDIDRATFGLDKNRLLGVLNKKTRAIIPVHLYGEDAGDFSQFGIPVIEDACEALGMVPIRGQVACYSFYGNKTISTGEGGMLCGKFGNAKQWRDGGFDDQYRHSVPGLNYRMSNMQAAIGLAQIERFDDLLSKRLANARAYSSQIPGRGKWLFCAETPDPVGLGRHLKEQGIDSRPIFTPLHLCPAYRVYAKGKYKVSEEVWGSHLALPTGPHVSLEQVEKIAGIVNEFNHVCRASNGDRQ